MNEPKKLGLVLLAIVTFGLFVLAIEWLRDRVNAWVALIIVSMILLVMALAIHPVRAHDHNRPGLDGWYMSLKSGKGPCCGGPSIDATTLDGPDWEANDGRYRVRLKGQWHDVPPDAVLTEPNKDGRTLVWPIQGWGGLTIRCFMPGSMT